MLTFTSSLAFIDSLGGPEMLLIFIMSLMLFGGKKLPELARSVGKTVREFKRAAAGVESEIRRAMDEESTPTPPARPKPPSTLPAAAGTAAGAASPEADAALDQTTDDYHDEYHHEEYHHEDYHYDHDEDHKDLEMSSPAEEPKVDESFEAGEPSAAPPQPKAPEGKSPETNSPAEDAPESPKPKA